MPALTIPNIPEDLMDIMERRAAANERSVEERRSSGCKAREAGA